MMIGMNSSFIHFVKDVYRRYKEEGVASLGAELAYFFLLSLFPFLVFLLQIITFLPIEKQDIFNFLRNYVPIDAMQIIESNVEQLIAGKNGGLLSVGLLATIWVASRASDALMRSLNKAYGVKENRPYWKIVTISFLLTIAFVFVIIFSLLIPVFGKRIAEFIFMLLHIPYDFMAIWSVVRIILSFGVIFLIFTFLYLEMPNIRLKIKEVVIGSLFATIGWVVTSYCFAFYVDHFGKYADTYGSIGGIIVLMTWFYLSGIILVLGGIINSQLKVRREGNKT
jgi:membrane protein